MSESNTAFQAAMGKYQHEVLRWNRQINLVSRKDTLKRVADLIGQCRDAWLELAAGELEDWDESDSVWYFDLGSGGGLPGFVWHQLLAGRFPNLKTWLVEPREKRAWFLERLNQITPDRPLSVWATRWGQTPGWDGTPPSRVVISLKALRLPDSVVLGGLNQVLGGRPLPPGVEVVIARFYPPEQRLTAELAEELGFIDVPQLVGDDLYRSVSRKVLGPKVMRRTAASLVVSTYRPLV